MHDFQLCILGRLDKESEKLFTDAGIFLHLCEQELILACDYSMNDVPIGHVFRYITGIEGNDLAKGEIALQSVSQQFFKYFEEIPKGWKTICRFEFRGMDMNEVRRIFPEVYGWNGKIVDSVRLKS